MEVFFISLHFFSQSSSKAVRLLSLLILQHIHHAQCLHFISTKNTFSILIWSINNENSVSGKRTKSSDTSQRILGYFEYSKIVPIANLNFKPKTKKKTKIISKNTHLVRSLLILLNFVKRALVLVLDKCFFYVRARYFRVSRLPHTEWNFVCLHIAKINVMRDYQRTNNRFSVNYNRDSSDTESNGSNTLKVIFN